MKRGFTLIEILVTIAIIGILSGIVYVSLSAARLKAQDVVVKSEAKQLRTLFESNRGGEDYAAVYSAFPSTLSVDTPIICDTGSGGLICTLPIPGSCEAVTDAKAQQICMSMFEHGSSQIIIGATKTDYTNYYSVATALPGSETFYCIGSSGRVSEDVLDAVDTGNPTPGCPTDP